MVPFSVSPGWRLDRFAWGNGYATEAAREALRFGFEDATLDEMVSFTSKGNAASMKVMERVGMHRDPADDFDYPNVPSGHPLRRHTLYRLTSQEIPRCPTSAARMARPQTRAPRKPWTDWPASSRE